MKSVTLPTRFVLKNELCAIISPEVIVKARTYIITFKSLAVPIDIQPGERVE